ncbi:MAG: metallophosphoesterase [Bacteroidales bacterium]|nr:metallophosphoesterase [Bacteroidales bacterium]
MIFLKNHSSCSCYVFIANFWLSCGDLIETSGSTNSEWEYEQFFQTQQDIFMNKPFAAVTGNHDKSANKNFTNHFN